MQSPGQIPLRFLFSAAAISVGVCLWAALSTRPDCAFAVNTLAQGAIYANERLINAAKKVIIYLYHTKELGIGYDRSKGGYLEGYVDASWLEKRSQTGFTFLLANGSISHKSKKQELTAMSSCEPELIAASRATLELIYLRFFLEFRGVKIHGPTPLMIDSQSAIDLANNDRSTSRTKHLRRRDWKLREAIEEGVAQAKKIHTSLNPSDILTKPLVGQSFLMHRDKLLNC